MIPNYFTVPGQFGEQYVGLQLKTHIIFQIAKVIYKAKHHMESECTAKLLSSRKIDKMQKSILSLEGIQHMKDILVYLTILNFF